MNRIKRLILLAVVLLAGVAVAARAQSQAGAQVRGESRWALVRLSSCNVRVAPDYESGLDTQFLMGRVVEVLGQDRYWVQVGYEEAGRQLTGWVNELMLTEVDEAALDRWLRAPRYLCTAESSHVYAEPSAKSDYLTEWMMGDLALQVLDGRGRPVREGKFLAVALPDGRRGYVPKGTATDFRRWAEECRPTAAGVIATAGCFLGSPYLWGGTTLKGVDCSGLVQLAFFMNGVLLPRNSSSQARCGVEVPLAEVRPGDLLTFGTPATDESPERISHIAISLGGSRILQSSQLVRINTLEPGQPDTYERTPLHARRILPDVATPDALRAIPGVTLVKDCPLYFAK